MSGIHARVAISGLSRTVICPGSLQLSESLPPEPETPESLEGDVAHWVAMQHAIGCTVPENVKHKGVMIDEGMVEGATLWAAYVRESPGAYEMPVAGTGIHPTECWGSTDYWAWIPELNLLRVGDYKYGHLHVEEFENAQGVGYCDSIIQMLGLLPHARVEFTIVQPRCYTAAPKRTWVTTAAHIRFLAKQFAGPVAEALGPSPRCAVSEECLFCPARGHCKTLQRQAERVIEYSRSMQMPTAYTPEVLGLEMALLEEAEALLKARKTGLAAMAEADIRSGKLVTGWQMKPGQSRLTWTDEEMTLRFAEATGINIKKPDTPITPTQALERKLIDSETMKGLASRPPAGSKLARVKSIETRKLFASNRS